MAAMTSKFYYVCVIQYYTDQWLAFITSRRPCWRYNTKEYVISSIVGSSRRGWLTIGSLRSTTRQVRRRDVNIQVQLEAFWNLIVLITI